MLTSAGKRGYGRLPELSLKPVCISLSTCDGSTRLERPHRSVFYDFILFRRSPRETDGEDQESQPLIATKAAKEKNGVRIFTIGLGDLEKGARVPVESSRGNDFLTHSGKPVWSKLDGATLEKIAAESGGAYIPAGTKQVNMADVYHRYIASVDQTEFETAKVDAYEARFQWFLAPALALLLLELLWMRGKSNIAEHVSRTDDSR